MSGALIFSREMRRQYKISAKGNRSEECVKENIQRGPKIVLTL
jgi:hypothetical protein